MVDFNSLTDSISGARTKGLPPVHLWNPPFCGDIGMRIASDGTWFYQESPIGRPAMVRLFASILRRDPDRFVLVTPVEMVSIIVDDAPFIAGEVTVGETPVGQILTFRTNVEDEIIASATHPLRFEQEATGGLKPYVLVRGGLWAKVSRAVSMELVALAVTREIEGTAMLGIESAGAFFPMMPASEIGEAL
jgi:uncharacterized protein